MLQCFPLKAIFSQFNSWITLVLFPITICVRAHSKLLEGLGSWKMIDEPPVYPNQETNHFFYCQLRQAATA